MMAKAAWLQSQVTDWTGHFLALTCLWGVAFFTSDVVSIHRGKALNSIALLCNDIVPCTCVDVEHVSRGANIGTRVVLCMCRATFHGKELFLPE